MCIIIITEDDEIKAVKVKDRSHLFVFIINNFEFAETHHQMHNLHQIYIFVRVTIHMNVCHHNEPFNLVQY